MKIKIKVAETAQRRGFKSAYALQKALDCSPTMASRLWKGNFKQIGIVTIDSLCELFKCSPNEFLEYPLTLIGNTQTGKAMQSSNTELSKTEKPVKTAKLTSDNERLFSTAEVAAELGVNERTVRDYYVGKSGGKLPCIKIGTKNFVRQSDLTAFVESRNV